MNQLDMTLADSAWSFRICWWIMIVGVDGWEVSSAGDDDDIPVQRALVLDFSTVCSETL